MNKALFLAVQLNVDEMTASPALVELLNAHLVFAVDVAEAADALVQLASVSRLSSGVEASVEIPAVALEQLHAQCEAELRRFVELRMDRQLRARVDSSDIVQEAQLDVFQRLPDFLARAPMPFWIINTS